MFSIRRSILAVALATALAAPVAYATIINVSDPGLVGLITGTESHTLNLSSQLSTFGAAAAGTLTLTFQTPSPGDDELRVVDSYSPGSDYSNEYITYTVTDDYVSSRSAATVAVGSNQVSGNSPTQVVSALAYTGTTTNQYIGPGDIYFVFETDVDYSEANYWAGTFTETLNLTSSEIAALNSTKSFTYSVTGTNSPRLESANLALNSNSPLPAPTGAGLMAVALGLLLLDRRKLRAFSI